MANIWKVVNTSTLKVRSGAGAWNTEVGSLSLGQKITEISKKNVGGIDWIQHSNQ